MLTDEQKKAAELKRYMERGRAFNELIDPIVNNFMEEVFKIIAQLGNYDVDRFGFPASLLLDKICEHYARFDVDIEKFVRGKERMIIQEVKRLRERNKQDTTVH